MTRRRVLIGGGTVGFIVAVVIAYWLISPLFRDTVVDEAFPFELPEPAAMETMTEEEKQEMAAEFEAAMPTLMEIEALAEAIATADGCMIYGSRGINQHSNGTQTNRALMFLAAMTGNWARPGGGYFNVSSATFIRADAPPERRAAPARPAVGRSPAAWLAAMTDADPYPITAMIGSNNPFALWPSQERVRAAD